MKNVKHLIIVAAPSCCGKSTFILQLVNDELGDIKKKLKIDDISSWTYKDIFLHEDDLINLTDADNQKLILHYTIPYPALRFYLRPGYDKKERMSILQASDDIILITLYASPGNLVRRVHLRRQRVIERRNQGKAPLLKYIKIMQTLSLLERIYSDPNKLIPMYNKWFDFCDNINLSAHYLINVDNQPQLVSISDWAPIAKTWNRITAKNITS